MTRRKPKTETQVEFLVRLDSVQIECIREQFSIEPPTYIMRMNEYEYENEWKEYRIKHEEVVVLATLLGKVV